MGSVKEDILKLSLEGREGSFIPIGKSGYFLNLDGSDNQFDENRYIPDDGERLGRLRTNMDLYIHRPDRRSYWGGAIYMGGFNIIGGSGGFAEKYTSWDHIHGIEFYLHDGPRNDTVQWHSHLQSLRPNDIVINMFREGIGSLLQRMKLIYLERFAAGVLDLDDFVSTTESQELSFNYIPLIVDDSSVVLNVVNSIYPIRGYSITQEPITVPAERNLNLLKIYPIARSD